MASARPSGVHAKDRATVQGMRRDRLISDRSKGSTHKAACCAMLAVVATPVLPMFKCQDVGPLLIPHSLITAKGIGCREAYPRVCMQLSTSCVALTIVHTAMPFITLRVCCSLGKRLARMVPPSSCTSWRTCCGVVTAAGQTGWLLYGASC